MNNCIKSLLVTLSIFAAFIGYVWLAIINLDALLIMTLIIIIIGVFSFLWIIIWNEMDKSDENDKTSF